jgi:hypothetical protein
LPLLAVLCLTVARFPVVRFLAVVLRFNCAIFYEKSMIILYLPDLKKSRISCVLLVDNIIPDFSVPRFTGFTDKDAVLPLFEVLPLLWRYEAVFPFHYDFKEFSDN